MATLAAPKFDGYLRKHAFKRDIQPGAAGAASGSYTLNNISATNQFVSQRETAPNIDQGGAIFYSGEVGPVRGGRGRQLGAAHVRERHAAAFEQPAFLDDAAVAATAKAGEVIDCSVMNRKALRAFFAAQMDAAKKDGILFSLHCKTTMMKISDPIIFGHCIEVFFADVFEKYAATFKRLGVDADTGVGEMMAKIETLPDAEKAAIKADIQATYAKRPALAMVNSDKGITNLHVPSDVIIDASVPAMIREGGKMWGPDGKLHDCIAAIPDRCYSTLFQAVIDDCKANGAFDPKTMGSVPNVGLMAQQAEEYGSHDKTFEISEDGVANITDLATGEVLLAQNVEEGDIWRMCQVKDAAVRDWVKLAVSRARNSGMPAVF